MVAHHYLAGLLSLAIGTLADSPMPDPPLECEGDSSLGTCAKKGRVAGTSPVAVYANVTSTDACRIECLNAQYSPIRCFSLGYNANAKVCSLYPDILANEGFVQNNKSSTVYYDFTCFECLYTYPKPVGENLLINPGFEAPIDSNNTISPWFGPYGVDNRGGPGYQSPHAAHGKGSARFLQRLRLGRGLFYDLTFKYKVKHSGTAPLVLSVKCADFMRTVYVSAFANNNKWVSFQTKTIQFDREADGDLEAGVQTFLTVLSIDLTSTGDPNVEFWVDDAVLTPSYGNFFGKGPQLVINGGFENGTNGFNISKRTPQKDYKVTTPGANGSKHALSYNGSAYSVLALSQELPLLRGVNYFFNITMRLVPFGNCDNFPVFEIELGKTGNGVGAVDVYSERLQDFYPAIGLEYIWYRRSIQAVESYGYEGTLFTLRFITGPKASCGVKIDDIKVQRLA